VEEDVEKRSASSASSATPTDDHVLKLFENPPDWLQAQLSKCRTEPARWMKPTCAAIAETVYSTATRWKEVEPVLRGWLEEVR